jgi:hypothetical protein
MVARGSGGTREERKMVWARAVLIGEGDGSGG